MTDLPGYDIRYTTLNDATYLKDWLSHPDVIRWLPMGDDKEIDNAVQSWISFCRYQCSLTAVIDGVPCGIGTLFLMPYRKVAHHCMIKLVVDPKFQRKGIGRSLLKNLKHLAKTTFRLDLAHIEVFEGNPILHLLKEFDFHPFASQPDYVKDGNRYLGRILLETFLK